MVFSSDTCNKVEIPLYDNAHVQSNVHTWASFFLRHLANTSFMVPFWASTDSGSVPIRGARVRSHAIRRRLFTYSPNDSCSHFTQRLFPPKVPWQRTESFLIFTIIACTHIIHHIHTYIYTFYFTNLIPIFISSGLHGRLAALSSLWPIQVSMKRYCSTVGALDILF